MDKSQRAARITMKTRRIGGVHQKANWAAKVRNVSRLGSQFKSFIFNVSPAKHATCRVTPNSVWIVNLPVLTRISYIVDVGVPPVSPQLLAESSVQARARPLRRRPGLVRRVVPPRSGATWATCAQTVA